jgi:hypothetical protein
LDVERVALDASPTALLEDASRKVDLLWEAALLSSDYRDAAIDFGDASQAIHRALVALRQYHENGPAPEVFLG